MADSYINDEALFKAKMSMNAAVFASKKSGRTLKRPYGEGDKCRTGICQLYARGICDSGDECVEFHDLQARCEEVQQIYLRRRAAGVCNPYVEGDCSMGQECTLFHDVAERCRVLQSTMSAEQRRLPWSMPEKRAAATGPRWQVQADRGWEDYEEDMQLRIEQAFKYGIKAIFAWKKLEYVIDPVTMTQTNQVSKKVREVRNTGTAVDERAAKRIKVDDAEVYRNDDGAVVSLGTSTLSHMAGGDGSAKFYCGRNLGKNVIPGSDGLCGPECGPQCAPCIRFQASRSAVKKEELKEEFAKSEILKEEVVQELTRKQKAEMKAKAKAEKAKAKDDAKFDALVKKEADAKAKVDAKEKAKDDAKFDALVKKEADAEAKVEAKKIKSEGDAADAQARGDAAKAKAEAKNAPKLEAEANKKVKAEADAAAKAKKEAETRAKADAKKSGIEAKAKAKAEAKAESESGKRSGIEAKAKAKAEANAAKQAKTDAKTAKEAKAQADAEAQAARAKEMEDESD